MSVFSETFLFQPSQITGCSLWLDAADSSSLVTSGNNVTQWNDKSGNANNFTSVNNPTTGNTRLNGNNILNLTNSSYFRSTSFILPVSYSIFAVAYTSGTSLNALMDSSPNQIFLMRIFSGTSMPIYWGSGSGGYVNLPNLVPVNTPALISFVNNNATLVGEGWANGTSLGTATRAAAAGNGTFGIGYRSFDSSSPWNGYIAEILIYNNTVLNTTQRQQVEGYLAWKWGLQGNLPSNHPYKTTRPLAVSGLSPQIAPPMPVRFGNSNVFVPTQISGCGLWLDAADRTTFTLSGSNISSWADKSGNGISVTQATSSNQPIYVSNVINGNAAVLFNAIARNNIVCFDTAAFNYGTTNRTSFFVLRNNYVSGGVANSPHWFWPKTGNGSAAQSLVGWIASIIRTTGASISVSSPFGSFFSLTNRFGSPTNFEQMYMNGSNANAATTTRGGAYINATSGYRIGGLDNADVNQTAYWFDGNIGEIILYNTTLTTAECQQVEGYLAWKWGLQANLPPGHPYKTAPIAAFSFTVTPRLFTNQFFSPTSITGCSLWLDGADASTVVLSGNVVSQWNDKSGNGWNATQTSAGNRPTYVSNTIKFVSASQQWMNLNQSFGNTLLNNAPFQIFIVVFGSGGGFIAGTEATNNQNLLILNDSINVFGSGFIAGTPPVAQSIQSQYSYEYSGSFARIYQNGTNFASGSTNLNLTSYPNPQIGRRYGGNSAAVYHDYTYSEIVTYNKLLTTPQRQQVEGYLAWKWKIQSQLPANHPYKLFPPPP